MIDIAVKFLIGFLIGSLMGYLYIRYIQHPKIEGRERK